MNPSTMIVIGLAGWVVVVAGAWVVARLAKARDVLRVVIWSFVGLNVVVYLPALLLIRPNTVAVRATVERNEAQVRRTAKSLDKLAQELDAAKAAAGPVRFAAVESLVGRARSELAKVGQEKDAKRALEQLKQANKLAREAQRQFTKARKAPGTTGP